jgi:hypothetical protein
MAATAYDAGGNPVAAIDGLGRQTDTDFDGRNRAWRVRQPAVTNAADPNSPVAAVRPTTTTLYDPIGPTALHTQR